MAQYEAQCSAVGSFEYSSYFKLYVILTNRDGNSITNQSLVDYHVYCQSSGSGSINAKHTLYFNLGGNVYRNETLTVNVSSPNAYIEIAKGTMTATHNSDGTLSLGFSASIQASSYGVSASISDTFNLTTIPRYAEINSFSIQSMGLNTAILKYSVSRTASIYCSVDGRLWELMASSTTSGAFTISGLTPNTQHSFAILVRAVDSGLDRISGTLYGNTLNIGTVTSAPDINFGDTATIVKSNPSGARNDLRIETLSPSTITIATRTQIANNYTLTLTDDEWDTLYKKLGNSNSITIRYVIDTIDGSNIYYHWVDRTLTLKGNKKTIRTNVSNSWKRGKLWTKVNGIWEKGVLWTNVSGTWKRGI